MHPLDQFELPHHGAVALHAVAVLPRTKPAGTPPGHGRLAHRGAGAIGCDALASGLLVLVERAFGAVVVGQVDVVLVRHREHILFKLFLDRFLVD